MHAAALKYILPLLLLPLCLLTRATPLSRSNDETINPDVRDADEDWMDFPKGDELDEIITRLQDPTNEIPVDELEDVPQYFNLERIDSFRNENEPERCEKRIQTDEACVDSARTKENEPEKMELYVCEKNGEDESESHEESAEIEEKELETDRVQSKTQNQLKRNQIKRRRPSLNPEKYGSPMPGVYFAKTNWRAVGSCNGKQVFKCFFVSKYGFEKARQMAIDKRLEFEKEGFSGCRWQKQGASLVKSQIYKVYKSEGSWYASGVFDFGRKKISKSFSENKYGKELAKKKAQRARQILTENKDKSEEFIRELLSQI